VSCSGDTPTIKMQMMLPPSADRARSKIRKARNPRRKDTTSTHGRSSRHQNLLNEQLLRSGWLPGSDPGLAASSSGVPADLLGEGSSGLGQRHQILVGRVP
jgi:hypothetical protein